MERFTWPACRTALQPLGLPTHVESQSQVAVCVYSLHGSENGPQLCFLHRHAGNRLPGRLAAALEQTWTGFAQGPSRRQRDSSSCIGESPLGGPPFWFMKIALRTVADSRYKSLIDSITSPRSLTGDWGITKSDCQRPYPQTNAQYLEQRKVGPSCRPSNQAWVSSCLPDIRVHVTWGLTRHPQRCSAVVGRHDDRCSANAQFTAVPTPAHKLSDPALTKCRQNPTFCAEHVGRITCLAQRMPSLSAKLFGRPDLSQLRLPQL